MSTFYSPEEDVILCKAYMEISQDPIIGRNQPTDNFWFRVAAKYNCHLVDTMESRTHRSAQSRMGKISAAVRKLKACLRNVENMNPSGASDEDIMKKAKILLKQDKNYHSGFKFDHVWDILKDFEKFQNDFEGTSRKSRMNQMNDISSDTDNPSPESPLSTTPGLDSFSISLGNSSEGSASKRPMGNKKAKEKRRTGGQSLSIRDEVKEANQPLIELMASKKAKKEEQRQIYLDLKKQAREDAIMAINLQNITDPNYYAYVQLQQTQIMARISQQNFTPHPHSENENLTGTFGNLGGSGSDIPDY